MKYKVTYDHEVVITYEAIVEADSVEEAKEKIENGDFISEEEVDSQGMWIKVKDVEKEWYGDG